MRALLALAACCAVARAETQTDVLPSVTLQAGADDNVLFDGLGGDQVARGGAGIRLKAWERLWSANAELRLSALAFDDRWRVVALGEARAGYEERLSPRLRLKLHARARAADDPLALAQVGLLAVQGRALGWKSGASLARRLTPTNTLEAGLSYDGVELFDPRVTDRGGSALGLRGSDRQRLGPLLSLGAAAEARAYFGSATAQTAALLPGVAYRPFRRALLELEAGPLTYFDAIGAKALFVGRARAAFEGRQWGAALSLSHDLAVPSSRGGVLLADLAEGVARWGDPDWELRGRAGLYRSQASPRDERVVPGYGLDAAAFRRLVPGVWLGVSAMRFERLSTDVAPALARDAIYLRLDLTGGRP